MKPEYQDFEGHRIEIRHREEKSELLIDNAPIGYGRLPDGKFFLHEYAYDWTDDLLELARRFIAYRRKVEDVRSKSAAQKGR